MRTAIPSSLALLFTLLCSVSSRAQLHGGSFTVENFSV